MLTALISATLCSRQPGSPRTGRSPAEAAAKPAAGPERRKDAPGIPKLTCDTMLGKLGRELRILGMDVEQKRGWGSTRGYRQARSRERVFLTRNTELKGQPGVLFIDSEKPDEQLGQVRREYGLSPEPDKALSRCLQCNVALEKITRDQARPMPVSLSNGEARSAARSSSRRSASRGRPAKKTAEKAKPAGKSVAKKARKEPAVSAPAAKPARKRTDSSKPSKAVKKAAKPAKKTVRSAKKTASAPKRAAKPVKKRAAKPAKRAAKKARK